jgi:GDP-L-fucose synthase
MKKILVLGGSGLVGKQLISELSQDKNCHVLAPRSRVLNLKEQKRVYDYMTYVRPDEIYFLSAKVGGMFSNMKYPADYGYDNGIMILNVLDSCKEIKNLKLLFMGSSCIYPRLCPQPMKEEYLLTGSLEPTNEMYALAKIYGVKMCEYYNKQYGTNYISCMPCNIYGPNDHFDLNSSHVISALLNKFHFAKETKQKEVICFGTGSAKREFIYVSDVATACIHLMKNYKENTHINVGTGEDISIFDLANLIKKIVGYNGEIVWDTSKPDGMPRKVLDISKIKNTGWEASIKLEDGLKKTYEWYKENLGNIKQ